MTIKHAWRSRLLRLALISGVAVVWLLAPAKRPGPVVITYPPTPLVALAAAPAGDMCALWDDAEPGLEAEPQAGGQAGPEIDATMFKRGAPPPLHYVVDPYPTFNGIALDTEHN